MSLMTFNGETNGEKGYPKLEQLPTSPNSRTFRYIGQKVKCK